MGNEKNEILELAGLLATLKHKMPEFYRHLMALIKWAMAQNIKYYIK